MARALVVLMLVLLAPTAVRAQDDERFPEVIDLPDGFRPEGVVIGRGATIYAGSLADGAIYAANLRTGEGAILVPGVSGRVTVGLSYDRRNDTIFAAGGATGKAYAFSAATGETLAEYTLTSSTPTFVNDVIVTREAAYFTDSNRAVFYKLPLGKGGSLPDQSQVQEIALGGDFTLVPNAFNANGIEATANGKDLIIVNSTQGALYKVDPASGVATLIDLGGGSVVNGDGILLRGRTLYVVQNRLNQIAVVDLDNKLTSGTIVELLTDDDFDIPTTVDSFGRALYAVNARFGTTTPEDNSFQIVRVEP
jgi:sugar lactone lactonase YvrE